MASNETRIQDFFREVPLDYGLLAHLLLSLLPATGKLRLRRLDRMEWAFGQYQVNILLITVGQGAFQVPLYWELLDNRIGNSSAADRIALLQTCVHVLGKHRIGLVLSDREFVGHVWLKWLKDNGLNFVMRLPYMDQLYARRWTIEQCFQNLKGQGFILEVSHLCCRHKLCKLVALVSLAYALCLSVGTVAHVKCAPIARKNHGYYATSLSRHGLNILRQITRPATSPHEPMAQMVDALLRWISCKIARYQPTKIVG
ncbi:hypothetical protein J7E24_02495 [Hymenobacter sp. ISL-91]|uniref:hypothetical protein n=1 Tax=Hymenobacter sp. ISL-91 TaxID=2819151 RepID=UPI001BE983D6|nr:hypothetical protein [Hymenobacter sp. ISL-91]MBT2556638.1 hypothetical protein [Hymenobacter sp. ISL-91]